MEDISQLALEIKNAKRVKIIGNNRTGLLAMQMRYHMSKIGFDAEAITDMVLIEVSQDLFHEGDLIILFSVYTNNKVYNHLIKNINGSKAKIVLITMSENTTLQKYCDYSFVLPCISRASTTTFLDDQALFFIFIEIVLAKVAS